MTTPQSTNSEVRRAESAPTASTREAAPYAQPMNGAIPGAVDAMLIDAIRASAGPYVPAPWRSRPDERSEQVFIQQVQAASFPTAAPLVATGFDNVLDHASETVAESDHFARDEVAANVDAGPGADEVFAEVAGASAGAASPDVTSELPWIDVFVEAPSDATERVLSEFHFDANANAAEDASAYANLADASSPSALFADESSVAPSVLDMLRIEQPVDFAESPSDVDLGASAESSDATSDVSDEAEHWPMTEAGDAMRALADDLVGRESGQRADADDVSASAGDAEAESSLLPTEAATDREPAAQPAPLPMWSDDDMMDIMPVAVTRNSSEQEHWAAQARREAEPDGSGEAVAQVLESLARRARGGELSVHGYAADMGDAAVLAAALASLLGVRR